MKRLRLDSAARSELLHETLYYEEVRPGAGARFRECVEAAFGRLRRAPEMGRPDEDGCRRMRVKGFPFSVVYREQLDTVIVFAIRPDARKPGYWRDRAR